MILIAVLTCLIWLFGVSYLGLVFYYRLTRKEVFVPFVPADTKGINTMCESLQLRGDEKVIDIGSGWGTIVFHLIGKYPRLSVTGIELNLVLHLIAVLRKLLFHARKSIRLIHGDAARQDYRDYDVIFLFMLSPFVNKVLVPKFEKELKKGTKVVSYVFPMKSKAFKETVIQLPAHNWKSAVYIYEKL